MRVTPRADRDALAGVRDLPGGAAIEARVRAVPVDGAANAAVIAMIARSLAVPRSTVTLERGASGRLKLLHVAGMPGALEARVEALIGGKA